MSVNRRAEAMLPLAWITGGGSGIGRALALALSQAGWRVAISGRDGGKLAAACSADPAGRLLALPLDVTDAVAVRDTVDSLEASQGPLQLVVLNAGDYRPMTLDAFDSDLFRHLMEVNYLGVVHGLDAVLPHMRARATGQILINASLSGYRGLPLAAPYSATKAALINLAESLRNDCLAAGIRLRLLNPGFVRSALTEHNDFDMPFLTDPEIIARHVVARLDSGSFEIAFPPAMTWRMKLLRLLPYRWYFPLLARVTRG
jgi:NAD(P)-dependent dehydrogenase (short-subunit alcohol dehydrogenase family)